VQGALDVGPQGTYPRPMTPEMLRSMVQSLAGVREDGDGFVLSDEWDTTVHAGRNGGGFSVPLVQRITLRTGFVVIDTRKETRYVLVEDEIRAIGQEPSAHDRQGRKTGFV